MKNDWNPKVYFTRRESLRMKNFIFKSSEDKTDLKKLFIILELIQKEQRHARYDLQLGLKHLDTIVKGVALMVSAPEAEEELGTTEDIHGGS